jgi:hypothetical protein
LEAGSGEHSLTDLTVSPLLCGERHCPEAKASITNISSTNFSLGHFLRAVCKGLVENLAKFISPEELLRENVDTIVATGTGLLQNPILQEELSTRYKNMRVIYDSSDLGAPFGVAEYYRNNFIDSLQLSSDIDSL